MAGYIKWLDEDPEMMKKIPPEAERVASFWIRHNHGTFLSGLLIFVGGMSIPIFWGGRHGGKPLRSEGWEGKV